VFLGGAFSNFGLAAASWSEVMNPPEDDGLDLEKSEEEEPDGLEAGPPDEAAAGRCWLCPSSPVIPPKREPC